MGKTPGWTPIKVHLRIEYGVSLEHRETGCNKGENINSYFQELDSHTLSSSRQCEAYGKTKGSGKF
jgi:hypothetical protein